MKLKHSIGIIPLLAGVAYSIPPIFDIVRIPRPSGTVSSGAYAVSQNGTIVSWAMQANGTRVVLRTSPSGESSLVYAESAQATSTSDGAPLSAYINDSGDVLLTSTTGNGVYSRITRVPVTGAPTSVSGAYSYAAGINNSGAIAFGYRASRASATHFVSVTGGAGVPGIDPAGFLAGSHDMLVSALNNMQVAVGIGLSPLNNTTYLPYVWRNGVLFQLATPPGYDTSTPHRLSDSGLIIGLASLADSNAPDGSQNSCIIWDGVNTHVVPPLLVAVPFDYWKVPLISPEGINDSAQCVGSIRYVRETSVDEFPERYDPQDYSQTRTFIIDDGQMYDLSSQLSASGQGWTIRSAVGITNSGLIVGSAQHRDEGTVAVLLRPAGSSEGAPPTPNLAPYSDLGVSSADGLTSAKDLAFSGRVEAGAAVRLLIDARATNVTTRAGRTGFYACICPNAPSGAHDYSIITTSKARVTSQPSIATTIIRDSVPPARLLAPALTPADAVQIPRRATSATRNVRPTLEGSAAAGNTVRLMAGGRLLGQAVADAQNRYSIQVATPLRFGATSLTVVQVKPSGASSAVSPGLSLQVLK